MNYRIISRLLAIAIVLGILFVSLNLIIPLYFPQNPKPSGNHVYLGEIYNGKSLQILNFSFQISISKSIFKSDYVTYSVFSTWDSNGSYDQLGVSTINGETFATYSYTVFKNNTITYEFNPKWFPIGAGTYSGYMSISNGYVQFRFDNKSFLAKTGGNYFVLTKYFKYGNASYAGTTIYEEIYNFKWVLPPINFNFSQIEGGNNEITSWGLFLHNLSSNYSSYVFQTGNTINIYDAKPFFLKGYSSYSTGSYSLKIADFQIPLSSRGNYYLLLLPDNYTYQIFSQESGKIYDSGTINIEKNTWFNITI